MASQNSGCLLRLLVKSPILFVAVWHVMSPGGCFKKFLLNELVPSRASHLLLVKLEHIQVDMTCNKGVLLLE